MPWVSDCGHPGQSRPQVLSGWAPPGEPRGGCEAPADPNPGRKTVRHPRATLPKEPGASRGSFPARWGQPRARWAELSWQAQSIQDSLPFPNPVCSDKKPKRRAKNERMKRERNDLGALCQQLLPLGDEGLPLLRLRPRAGVAQAPQHPLVAGAVAGPRGENVISPRGGRLLHPHHQPLLILLGRGWEAAAALGLLAHQVHGLGGLRRGRVDGDDGQVLRVLLGLVGQRVWEAQRGQAGKGGVSETPGDAPQMFLRLGCPGCLADFRFSRVIPFPDSHIPAGAADSPAPWGRAKLPSADEPPAPQPRHTRHPTPCPRSRRGHTGHEEPRVSKQMCDGQTGNPGPTDLGTKRPRSPPLRRAGKGTDRDVAAWTERAELRRHCPT